MLGWDVATESFRALECARESFCASERSPEELLSAGTMPRRERRRKRRVVQRIRPHLQESVMLSWTLAFFLLAIVAALFGFSGIAGAATQIAWILFVLFLVLFAISLIRGRGPRI
jgi:uncharacterized membrane protein YtjA (UPF0391 family)